MAFVTENDSQSLMFIPIPDNPLHLPSSSKKPLFSGPSLSPDPLPSIPSPSFALQRKSSFKNLMNDTASSEGVKHAVRWSSPISASRVIPSRELDTTEDTPVSITGWSISQSLKHSESSQSENTTLLELGSHSLQKGQKRSTGSALSFSRPKAIFSQPEELHARMNLMHLHKVIQPKILSKHFSNSSTNPSRRRVTTGQDSVYRPATSINLPRLSRSNQNDSLHSLQRLKRKSSTPGPNKRPKKASRTDKSTLAASFRESDAPVTDGFEPVESLLDQLTLSSAYNRCTSTVERSTSAEQPDQDDPSDDEEMLSDKGSLLSDHGFMECDDRDDATAATRQTQRSQSKNFNFQTQGPRRPLNSIKVVTWTNGLKRFDYLFRNKKMDWRCEDELYELLKAIDVEKDNVTVELLKKTHVGKMIKDLSRCGKFEERSRILAKSIYRSWLKMCRAVD